MKNKFFDKIKEAKIERTVEDVYNEGINLYFPTDKGIEYPFAKVTEEISEMKDKFNEMKAKWESEKAAINSVKNIKEEIERATAEMEEAQRTFRYEEAARLKYSVLPELQKKLEQANKDSKNTDGTDKILRD